jgi:uncharacterized alpha-E superfamily protein
MEGLALLSLRAAESLYWLARYTERARHTARVVELAWYTLLDFPQAREKETFLLWALRCLRAPFPHGDAEAFTSLGRLAWSAEDPFSVRSCVYRLRENARILRFQLPEEVWKESNQLYWAWNSARGNSASLPPGQLLSILTESFSRAFSIEKRLLDSPDPIRLFAGFGLLIERLGNLTAVIFAQEKLQEEGKDLGVDWSIALRAADLWENHRLLYGPKPAPLQAWRSLLGTPEMPGSFSQGLSHLSRIFERFSALRPELKDRFSLVRHRLNEAAEKDRPSQLQGSSTLDWCVQVQAACNEAHESVWSIFRESLALAR